MLLFRMRTGLTSVTAVSFRDCTPPRGGVFTVKIKDEVCGRRESEAFTDGGGGWIYHLRVWNDLSETHAGMVHVHIVYTCACTRTCTWHAQRASGCTETLCIRVKWGNSAIFF